MTKEKLIKIIYLIIFSSIISLLFFYPNKNDSRIYKSIYLSDLIFCNVEIISPAKIDYSVEKWFRDTKCPRKEPLISIQAQDFNHVKNYVIYFLFILSIIIVWFTRKYAVCLAFYLNKGLKNIFKKI